MDNKIHIVNIAFVVSLRRNVKLVSSQVVWETWRLGVTFLDIVDFDVVDGTIIIALFNIAYIFSSTNVLLYISLDCENFVQRTQKWRQLLYTLLKKNQLLTQVKGQHPLWHFNVFSISFFELANSQYNYLLNFAESEWYNQY